GALAGLESLVAAGRAVRVKPDVYYEAVVLDELRRRLLDAAAESGGEISLAEVKDLLGTSRKYAQALLEHLDSCHLTIRHGDRHVLRRSARARAEAAGAAGA
ncbi:MAG: SelB C-terminal domain-containing protein, partial [Solirubrobacterales bacterium]